MSHLVSGPMPHAEPIYRYSPALRKRITGNETSIHISKLRIGMRFTASGRRFRVVYRRENRFHGGRVEYDVQARCLEDGKLYLFHVSLTHRPVRG